jgi:hypothetical protein
LPSIYIPVEDKPIKAPHKPLDPFYSNEGHSVDDGSIKRWGPLPLIKVTTRPLKGGILKIIVRLCSSLYPNLLDELLAKIKDDFSYSEKILDKEKSDKLVWDGTARTLESTKKTALMYVLKDIFPKCSQNWRLKQVHLHTDGKFSIETYYRYRDNFMDHVKKAKEDILNDPEMMEEIRNIHPC